MNMGIAHDWILVSINFDWQSASLNIHLQDLARSNRLLIAEGVSEFRVPRKNEWGPSISVNEVTESEVQAGDGKCLQIEMQSGDTIVIKAKKIIFPA